MYSITTALEKISAMDKRIRIVQGGARAGKTVAILILLLDLSFEVQNKIISVVSDTYPNLERGVLTDFKKLLTGTNRRVYFTENKVRHVWENLCTHTVIEFMSTDTMGALGAARDYLFVNECNRISYETFDQLLLRTSEYCFIDYNPVNEFWVQTKILKDRTDWDFLKLTYLDNENIPDNILKDLLQHKGDGTSNWWRVYGLGEIGSLEGNVYEGWVPCSRKNLRKAKDTWQLVRYGLDFGFSNDETALVEIYKNTDEKRIGVVERLFKTHMLPSDYIPQFELIDVDKNILIVADGARPEIIAQIKNAGYRIISANKDAGSVRRGIDKIRDRQICYDGKNLEREYLTYAWRRKRGTGEILDEAQDGNDHLLDAMRYAIDDMTKPRFDF